MLLQTSLELGCGGSALPSIIAAWQGAAATASDGDSATLKLARRNLEANTAGARHLPRTTQLRYAERIVALLQVCWQVGVTGRRKRV